MRKGLFILTAIMIAAVLPVYLFAQGEPMKAKECEKSCQESMQKLDKETSLKIEKLGIDLKLRNVDLEKKRDGIHEQLFKEFTSDNPGRKTIDKLAAEMRDVQAALMSNRHDFLLEVRKLLSADQFKTFMSHHGCGMGRGCCTGEMGGHGCMMGREGHGSMSGERGHCCTMGKDGRSRMGGSGCRGEGMGAGGCGVRDGKEMGCDMKVIKVQCETMGCGHTDKSQCTDECLKKCQEIKVIEKK